MPMQIHTQATPGAGEITEARVVRQRRRGRVPRAGRRAKLSHQDRLMRSSAVACALLLGILALGNIHQPWAEKASESIERALTMHIDLDESIGSLTFVRQIMPESALVFLNLSGESELTRPVSGTISHSWSNVQPWVMFDCDDGTPVFAAKAGVVTAVSPLSGGKTGLLIDHGEGLESVYANLTAVSVAAGESVKRGQALGETVDGLYYEYRDAGQSIDPGARFGK